MLESSTAQILAEMMRNNVVEEYGDSGFSGLDLCAKTGTAQVDDGAAHAWFVGFCGNEEIPLAFVVVVEHGGSGSSAAIPVAKKVLAEAKKLYE